MGFGLSGVSNVDPSIVSPSPVPGRCLTEGMTDLQPPDHTLTLLTTSHSMIQDLVLTPQPLTHIVLLSILQRSLHLKLLTYRLGSGAVTGVAVKLSQANDSREILLKIRVRGYSSVVNVMKIWICESTLMYTSWSCYSIQGISRLPFCSIHSSVAPLNPLTQGSSTTSHVIARGDNLGQAEITDHIPDGVSDPSRQRQQHASVKTTKDSVDHRVDKLSRPSLGGGIAGSNHAGQKLEEAELWRLPQRPAATSLSSPTPTQDPTPGCCFRRSRAQARPLALLPRLDHPDVIRALHSKLRGLQPEASGGKLPSGWRPSPLRTAGGEEASPPTGYKPPPRAHDVEELHKQPLSSSSLTSPHPLRRPPASWTGLPPSRRVGTQTTSRRHEGPQSGGGGEGPITLPLDPHLEPVLQKCGELQSMWAAQLGMHQGGVVLRTLPHAHPMKGALLKEKTAMPKLLFPPGPSAAVPLPPPALLPITPQRFDARIKMRAHLDPLDVLLQEVRTKRGGQHVP